jgi:hypothetical protein
VSASSPIAPVVSSPAPRTPPRRPGSVRRTTTHDSLRPDGLLGPVHLDARARDLLTAPDGTAATLAEASVEGRIDYVTNRTITALRSDPPAPELEGLVGLSASSGFRRALDEAMPDEDRGRSLRYQLLDDVPTALLVAGYAIGAAGLRQPGGSSSLNVGPVPFRADICAGWATGGTLLQQVAAFGHPQTLSGPDAPGLLDADDAVAWHPIGELGPHDMRRARRIDVWPTGDEFGVEAFFRDVHTDAQGRQTIVHEYLVRASVDRETGLFTACEADFGALPYPECPSALASASRLVGTPATDVRSRVKDSFTGTSTCTHLNDTLRSLAGVPHLISVLRG